MTVAAIDRCISMIELLASVSEPMELSEIAAQVGLPTSGAHRTLATLMSRGWVTQDPATQNYGLSLRMGLLAFRNLDAQYVPDVANEVLRKLAAKTQEYCRLAVAENGGLTWIARAQGARHGLRYDPEMGVDVILHATATGKAWLANLPEADALKLAYAEGFGTVEGMGPNYIRDIDTFRQHLNSARVKGYATAVDEGEAGATALAVPFFSNDTPEAAMVGTISVAGPTLRVRPARYAEISRELKLAARELSAIWPLRIRQRDFNMGDFSTGHQKAGLGQ